MPHAPIMSIQFQKVSTYHPRTDLTCCSLLGSQEAFEASHIFDKFGQSYWQQKLHTIDRRWNPTGNFQSWWTCTLVTWCCKQFCCRCSPWLMTWRICAGSLLLVPSPLRQWISKSNSLICLSKHAWKPPGFSCKGLQRTCWHHAPGNRQQIEIF